MSNHTEYAKLFDKLVVIAKSYYMGNLVTGFTPELMNILLTNHLSAIRNVDSYEQVLDLANTSLTKHLGSTVLVQNFITVESDRKELYSLFMQWRALLLERCV